MKSNKQNITNKMKQILFIAIFNHKYTNSFKIEHHNIKNENVTNHKYYFSNA